MKLRDVLFLFTIIGVLLHSCLMRVRPASWAPLTISSAVTNPWDVIANCPPDDTHSGGRGCLILAIYLHIVPVGWVKIISKTVTYQIILLHFNKCSSESRLEPVWLMQPSPLLATVTADELATASAQGSEAIKVWKSLHWALSPSWEALPMPGTLWDC